jgi:hypothetical protein
MLSGSIGPFEDRPAKSLCLGFAVAPLGKPPQEMAHLDEPKVVSYTMESDKRRPEVSRG